MPIRTRTVTVLVAAAIAIGAFLAWRLGGTGPGDGPPPPPPPVPSAPASAEAPGAPAPSSSPAARPGAESGSAAARLERAGSELTPPPAPAPAGAPEPAAKAATARGSREKKVVKTGIAGTVIGADGRPVARAEVSASIRLKGGRSSSTRNRTGEDGAYLVAVEPGSYAVSVRDDRHRPAARADVAVREGEVTRGVDFALEPGPAIVGRVTDDAGAPIAGAQVHAWPQARELGRALPDTETDADGRYRLGGIDAGRYEVSARSDDHLRGKRVPVEAPPIGEVVVDLTLERGLAIEGIVLDPAGQPVARATVATEVREVETRGSMRMVSGGSKEATTGDDGRFRLGGLPAGVYDLEARLHRPRSSYAPGEARGIAAGTSGVRIALGLAGAIEGVVRDGGTGGPVANVRVEARPDAGPGDDDDDDRGRAGAVTSEDGTFRLGALAPGAYTVVATGKDRPPAEVRGVVIATGATATVEVVLEAGAEVAVRVVALPGRAPVAGARIAVDDRFAYSYLIEGGRDDSPATDASGRFALRGLTPGKHRIGARAEGYPPGATEVDVPAHGRIEVEIVLPVGGAIEGRVLDAAGRPLPGAKVFAESMAIGGGKAEVGADGRYRIGGLAAGTYFVGVQPQGEQAEADFDFSRLRTVNVRAGETVVVDLEEGEGPRRVAVAGLLRRRGQPAPGTKLGFLAATGGEFSRQREAETDAEGRYRVELLPGRYFVIHGEMTLVGEIDVPANVAEARIDIDAPPGAIHGRVVDGATGTPIAGARVAAVRSAAAAEKGGDSRGGLYADVFAGMGGQGTTGADGAFEILDVRAGTYDLGAEVEKLGSARLPGVRVGDGTVEGLVLRLVRGATLSGRVVDDTGAPVPQAQVMAVPGAGPLEAAALVGGRDGPANAGGVFAIEGLTPGPYTLIVFAEGRAPGRAVVHFRGEPAEAPVVIALPKAGVLTVTVVRADGTPAAGASVDLRDPDGGFVIASIMQLVGLPAGAEGAIHFPDVAPGRYRATARLGDVASPPVIVEVRPGETTAVRLQVE